MPDMVKSISEIFSNQVFQIPDYQRGYAWEQKQWDDLLEDLELLPENRSHFTGTLVLRAAGNGGKKILDIQGKAYTAYDVIDGQQRLTTIIILLKAIYEEMQRIPGFEPLATGLREQFLFSQDLNHQPFTKLVLNADSQAFFADTVLELHPGIGAATISSHERLIQARRHFADYLQNKREALKAEFHNWLQRIYFKLIHQLTLIVYPVDDELDAGVIFETMNDRGRQLTELEKVKNFLLYVSSKLDLPAGHDLNLRINTTWRHIYETLMTSGLAGRNYEDQLLRAHWLMAYDYEVSRWDNSRSIKARFALKRYVGRHADLLHDLIQYIDSLHNSATAYCDIYRPGRSGAFQEMQDANIRQQAVMWSRKLARLGPRAAFLPALMALRMKAVDGGQAYLKGVQACEKYDFRVFVWVGARSNAGETALYRLANNYFRSGNAEWLIEEIAQKALEYCPDTSFNKRFDQQDKNWYQWGGISYLLYEYEHHLAGGRPVEMSWETLQGKPKAQSIEHILPQTPEDPYWLERFNEEQRQWWTNDLGNLTLTYDNSSLGNRRYPLKKGEPGKRGTYADSPLFIERQIAQSEDWTGAEIVRRRNEIKAWAQKRWKIDAKPREQKPPKNFEDVVENAERLGMADTIKAIHAAANRLGIWPTIRTGLQYRSPRNYRQSVFVVYIHESGISIYYRLKNFSHLKNLDAEIARQVFSECGSYANEGSTWYPPEAHPALAEAFTELARVSQGE